MTDFGVKRYVKLPGDLATLRRHVIPPGQNKGTIELLTDWLLDYESPNSEASSPTLEI